MRIVRLYSFIISIALLLICCSCAKMGGNDLSIRISPSDKSLIDLSSKVYSESQLSELVKFNGSIGELNAKHPIYCLRENNGIYRVSYLGYGRIAILLFDNNGNRLSGNTYRTMCLRSDFDSIAIGQSLAQVQAIDPDGEYLFLFTGRSGVPRVSSHYTIDGYLITIEYDSLDTIISIVEDLV